MSFMPGFFTWTLVQDRRIAAWKCAAVRGRKFGDKGEEDSKPNFGGGDAPVSAYLAAVYLVQPGFLLSFELRQMYAFAHCM